MTASLCFNGSFEGALTVDCTLELAGQIAAAMFLMEPADLTDAEIADAMGEIANIIGGRLKEEMPDKVGMSTPSVSEGVDYTVIFPACSPVSVVTFIHDNDPLQVTLLKHD